MAIRLILADDHPIVLHGLQQLLERSGDFEIVAACTNGPDALAAVRRIPADVLLLDLRMPGMSGLAVLRTLAAEQLPIRTILLSAAVAEDQLAQARQLGVCGVVLKESAPETLFACIRQVSRGESWAAGGTTPAGTSAGRTAEGGAAADTSLTPRELEIVRMIAEGLRNKEIGERLAISEGTVKVHLHNVYQKLSVDGRLELVLFAQARGLV